MKHRVGMTQRQLILAALVASLVVTALLLADATAQAKQVAAPRGGSLQQGMPPAELVPLTPEEIRAMAARPWLTPTPSPPVPKQLNGMILFRSDLASQSSFSAAQCRAFPAACDVFAFDPTTGDVSLLTDPWPYECAEGRDAYSANRQYRALVQEEWIEFSSEYGPDNDQQLQIKYYDRQFKVIKTLSHFGARFFGPDSAPFGDSWDPVWSPAGDSIAFVSNEAGNDDIYVVTKDRWPGHQLTRNEWAGDKHPSWSPDGRQIVFESNRDGQYRLWIMNADGSNQRPLTDPIISAFAPVWVKYVGTDGCP